MDSSNIVAAPDRFGRKNFSATAEADGSDDKARDIDAQLSVGKRRRYKRMQLLYEGLWSSWRDQTTRTGKSVRRVGVGRK
jgi:hypothetical protein